MAHHPVPLDPSVIPAALGAALNLIADSAFRTAKTTVKPFQESAALITDGVYRISRHPMYLGLVLILRGLDILLGSLTPFLIVPIFIIVIDWCSLWSKNGCWRRSSRSGGSIICPR